MQRSLLVGALTLGVALAGSAQAAAAGFDDTFGINGTVFNSLSPASDRYQGATRAPGGGTYNVGYTTVDRDRPRVRPDARGLRRPDRS